MQIQEPDRGHEPSFGSDNHSGVHPRVLKALAAANRGHCKAYGADAHTEAAEALFRDTFRRPLEVFFVFTGTAANTLAIRSLCASYESVLATDLAHIQVDECGAPEWISGCKILTSPHVGGKLRPEAIEQLRIRPGDPHRSLPKMISITQASELGTIYHPHELKELVSQAHARGLLVHMDGARLANAAATLGCDLATACEGVDALSFGGTKNGLMCGEALVFFRPELSERFAYHRKQNLQLASKMRFLSSQFLPYLGEGLWLENASKANAAALYLRERLAGLWGESAVFPYPTEANEVFVSLPEAMGHALKEVSGAYSWDETSGLLRLVTSFDVTRSDIDRLLEKLKRRHGER